MSKPMDLDELTAQAADLANALQGLELLSDRLLGSTEVSTELANGIQGITAVITRLATEHYLSTDEYHSQLFAAEMDAKNVEGDI